MEPARQILWNIENHSFLDIAGIVTAASLVAGFAVRIGAWRRGRRGVPPGECRPRLFAALRATLIQKGMIRGRSALAEVNGLNSTYMNALVEGGSKNGVLTAIEDFIAQNPRDYRFFRIHYQYGLGVLQFGPGGGFDVAPFRDLKVKAFFFSPVSRLSRSLKFAFKKKPDA